ncbi:2Fe-2S ferredoxin [Chondrocystis sp. NIES-4102]|nr:2Fe-2S ferredoxin [Chondrocystis sp. NIES-4102]
MKTYRIELINRDNFTLEITADKYILEGIEQAGLSLPVGCRYGACITCAAKLIKGKVDQSQAICLKPEQIKAGYVLLCIAKARSSCTFEVGLESQAGLYFNPFL